VVANGCGSQEGKKGPSRSGQRACDLGALGEIRTPNLLIHRSIESVRLVRWSPYPQVMVHWVSGIGA